MGIAGLTAYHGLFELGILKLVKRLLFLLQLDLLVYTQDKLQRQWDVK